MEHPQSTAPSAGANSPPIFVISGGAGAVGEQVARVALSQFQGASVRIIVTPQVRHLEQLEAVMDQVEAARGTVLHTMVNGTMRRALMRMARERRVVAIDLLGGVLARLTTVLGREPSGQPGLYSRRRDAHLDRLDAIDFTMEHDDGRLPDELKQAEIVLVGVSRVGKTPLSMYLAVLGWKVANVPFVKDLPLPEELFTVDRRRVIGLVVDAEQIAVRRRWRQRRMGVSLGNTYTDLSSLEEELSSARRIFRQHGFATVNLTDKPIEESADEIIALVNRWFTHGNKLDED